MYSWAFFFFILAAAGVSVWLRMDYRRVETSYQTSALSFPEAKPSQLSNAVQGLMATAGGVYLSLVMIVSFLKINIPQVISLEFWRQASPETAVDPLALISIMLAIIEPLVLRAVTFVKKIDFL